MARFLTIYATLYIAVNPMARQDLWIIADADSADKMLKLHELRNLASTDKDIELWYMFKHFDILSQSAAHYGNSLIELETGLNKMLSVKKRPPHSIVFLIGNSILNDELLTRCPSHLRHVLSELCRQLKRMMQKWVSFLPNKAKPLQDVQFFINKPLPKPESPYMRWNAMDKYQALAAARNSYNTQLIRAVHDQGFKFLNPGISSKDADLFDHIKHNSFKLTPKGLTAFWESISDSLDKLHTNKITASSNAPQALDIHQPQQGYSMTTATETFPQRRVAFRAHHEGARPYHRGNHKPHFGKTFKNIKNNQYISHY